MKEQVEDLYLRLKQEADQGGYHLNPDSEYVNRLLSGLLVNKERYGYLSCPCRLARGKQEIDLDIICPCDYRDDDLREFHMCYCGLYVSDQVVRGEEKIHSIPERRPPGGIKATKKERAMLGSLPLPVYRCKVCGYLCARKNPPEVCPICKASAERFEVFIE